MRYKNPETPEEARLFLAKLIESDPTGTLKKINEIDDLKPLARTISRAQEALIQGLPQELDPLFRTKVLAAVSNHLAIMSVACARLHALLDEK